MDEGVTGDGSTEGGVTAADLEGTWRLRSWRSVAADGSTVEPFGPRPLGYVVYTPGGHMITTISAGGREPIGGDLLSGPDAGRLEAFATFLAYSGTYQVRADEVFHRVEMSLFPDWVGTEQRREVELSPDGHALTLSTGPMEAAGRSGRHVLRWERVET